VGSWGPKYIKTVISVGGKGKEEDGGGERGEEYQGDKE